MARNSARRGNAERGKQDKTTSVVGSKLGDTGNMLLNRRLPKGGIREQGSLSIAEGAMPDSTTIGKGAAQQTGISVLRVVALVSAALIVILLVVAIALAILAHTSAFVIDTVEATGTEHAKAEDIARLVVLEDGATLLSIDDGAIRDSVCKNPWISNVDVERIFPGTIRIHATERIPRALVSMGTGGVAWLLGDDGHWIEPVSLEVGEDEATRDAALAKASEYGAVLIANVPSDVVPVAGSACTDSSVLAALSFEDQFSSDFASEVVSYNAPGADDIACVLKSGVEVSLGSSTSVSSKEQIVLGIVEEYGGRVTYINVRVPSRPTFRYVDSPYVKEGTGANGSSAVETKPLQEHVTPDENATQAPENETSTDDYGYDSGNGYDYDYGYDSGYDTDYDSGYDTGYDYDYVSYEQW